MYINSTNLKTLKNQTFIFDGDHLSPNWRKKVHEYYQNQLEPVDEKYQIIKECEKFAKLSFQHLDDSYDSFTSTILNNMRSDTFAKLWNLQDMERYECEFCNCEATIEHVLTECSLIYDSIKKLEENMEQILQEFGIKKEVEVFWENEDQIFEKDKLSIGIRGMFPKDSVKFISKMIRKKLNQDKKELTREELIKQTTKELKRCIYNIHKEIAKFGWYRIKNFWKWGKFDQIQNHFEDIDFNEEEAELLMASSL